jgi:HlyD family secretion protein
MNSIRMIMNKCLYLFCKNEKAQVSFNSRWLKYGILALGILGILGFACYKTGAIGSLAVVGVKVENGTLRPTVFGIGTVQAQMNYNVGPTQAGKILKLYVDQGDSVKIGQIIGEIDPVDMDQRIASNYATVVSSQHDTAVASAQIEQAKSQNQLAQAEVERYTQLFAQGAISKELLESKENDAQAAQSTLDSALSNYRSTRSKVVKADADYQGQIEQKRNLLLISPVNGIVVSRNMEEGSTAAAGQTIYNIIDPATLWVQTRIDQTSFKGIALGQTADIVLRSKQDIVMPGKVTRLEAQGDTVTEERFVDIRITDAPDNTFLGDLADVTINLPETEDCLYIPAAAVKTVNGKSGVWIVQNSKAYYKFVTTGVKTMEGKIQIINGLEPDDTVIVYSKPQIAEGVRVRLVSAL